MQNCSFPVTETSKPRNDNWDRNEKEDMKLAIEYLYEFNEKLSKLHPQCKEHINHMLQDRRF